MFTLQWAESGAPVLGLALRTLLSGVTVLGRSGCNWRWDKRLGVAISGQRGGRKGRRRDRPRIHALWRRGGGYGEYVKLRHARSLWAVLYVPLLTVRRSVRA